MVSTYELEDLRFTSEGCYFAMIIINTFLCFLRYKLSKPTMIPFPSNFENISVSQELVCPIP